MSDTIKRRVVEFFDAHPHQALKSRQVARRLGIRDEETFQTLRTVLHSMVDEKVLSHTRGKGYFRRPPANKKGSSSAVIPERGFQQGTLTIFKQGHGIVSVDGDRHNEIYIGPKFLGTGMSGDTVEVALFAAHKKHPKNKDERREGEIVSVLLRANSEIVGTLEQSKNFFFVIPDDNTVPRDIYIPQDKVNGARPGDKVVVKFESWESDLLNPEGAIVEIIGRAGEVSAEITSVIKAFHLPNSFPHEVEEYVRKIPERIPEEEIALRTDLRSLVCFTIDPFDAKDFDDAISIEQFDGETFRLGVHIADVSAYVKENTPLDAEAYKRGTSVYLANQVVPMLPEKLSNNVCSLNPRVDRLAYTCFMDISAQGKVIAYSIEKSVINSKRRFTYEEVEKILDSGEGDFVRELSQVWSLASTLRKKRMKSGSVDFDTREAKFRYDTSGKPIAIIVKERLKSHQLVEECMLMANQTVAKHIGMSKQVKNILPFMYRVHNAPDMEKLRELALFVQKFGYALNVSSSVSSKALQKLLNDVKGTPEENVITEVALRSMAKAVYSEKNIGHYGLGFDYYTHFTSPIRRYPDLIVHRMLEEYARGMAPARRKHYISRLPEMGRWSSERERVAMEAERASVKVMQAEYMKQHMGDEFDGIISGVTHFGIFIEINELLVEGMLHVRNIDDDYYIHNEKQYSLVGQRHGRAFRLGDPIRVRVMRVDVENREIDFAYVPEAASKAKKKKKQKHT
ncbi:MAG: ribonuclease R [Bacteroidota bacterium]|nr:ribonuclease R [Bacteroidota bacterium]